MACDVGRICVTTANEGGISAFEKRFGKKPAPGNIQRLQ